MSPPPGSREAVALAHRQREVLLGREELVEARDVRIAAEGRRVPAMP